MTLKRKPSRTPVSKTRKGPIRKDSNDDDFIVPLPMPGTPLRKRMNSRGSALKKSKLPRKKTKTIIITKKPPAVLVKSSESEREKEERAEEEIALNYHLVCRK